ncbi:MAG TPA: hypothetical protein VK638_55750 [Edaphobacter sp.]|nr:hypothetical protein [Edaphobacter sp.]
MTNTAKRLLSDIRELAPNITSRAEEIEAGRRIPLDLVKANLELGGLSLRRAQAPKPKFAQENT